ncbi:MAG: acyl-CoA mutase large subunit family protein [Bacteroidetes bacterium]|nr:acyl-CoA mutase large subunit family protein [Bacteroidota bacterium]
MNKSLFHDFPVSGKEQWRKKVIEDLKGADVETLQWKTYDGFSVDPLYVRDDIASLRHTGSLPGLYPYVRGTHALGHAGRPWNIAQISDLPIAKDAAKEIVSARERGQNCVVLQLDRSSIQGLGTDQALEGAGHDGISIQHIPDFRIIIDRLEPQVPFDIHAGMSSPVLLAMCAATERNVDHLDFHPLAHLIREGSLPYSIHTTFSLLRDAISYVEQRAMPSTLVGVCGDYYHNAGASTVQELACILASGVEYINRLTDMGLSADAVARRMRFSFPVGMSFFMEIAKLRAARMLWTRVLDSFGLEEDATKRMHVRVRTSWWHQTTYDPYVNMLRSTIESMAGIIGGADSMYTAPFDEVLPTSSQFSKRIARNQQIILREEAHLGHVTDPAAGSCYIEMLTSQIAGHAWKMFQEIERQGGYIAAIEKGFIQETIGKTAQDKRNSISRRRQIIVGSNKYPNLTEKPVNGAGYDKEVIANTVKEALNRHLETRTCDPDVLKSSLYKVLRSGSGNLIAAIAAALQEGLTVAEVNDVLRQDEEKSPTIQPLAVFRAAGDFERLRNAVGCTENKPRIFLATYGPAFWRRARATFAAGFFGSAGIDVIDHPGYDSPEAAAIAAIQQNAQVIVACSDDESYPEMVPKLLETLRNEKASMIVVVAGNPKEHLEMLTRAGVDLFIHVKTDVGETLNTLLRSLGIQTEMRNEE